jgi:hypothetical protein
MEARVMGEGVDASREIGLRSDHQMEEKGDVYSGNDSWT